MTYRVEVKLKDGSVFRQRECDSVEISNVGQGLLTVEKRGVVVGIPMPKIKGYRIEIEKYDEFGELDGDRLRRCAT